MATDKIKFEITRHVGVLSEGSKGWRKEFNLVSWNDRPAKIDIRDWDETHEKMGKGITMTKDEFKALLDMAKDIEDFITS